MCKILGALGIQQPAVETFNISSGEKYELAGKGLWKKAKNVVIVKRQILAIPQSDVHRTYIFICAVENTLVPKQFFDNVSIQMNQITSFCTKLIKKQLFRLTTDNGQILLLYQDRV